MVGAIEDMQKSQLHKPQRRLMPAWIERHQTWIALELIGSHHRAAGRQKPQHRDHAGGQTLEPRANREGSPLGLNRVFKQHVQQHLIPDQIGAAGRPRSLHMSQRFIKGCERGV